MRAGSVVKKSLGGLALLVFLLAGSSFAQITFERTYGGSEGDWSWSVQQTQDGGYVIAGGTASFGSGGTDVYVVKTDSMGNALWERTYGGSDYDYGRSVRQTLDGGYIVAGWTTSFGAGEPDVYVIKTDSLGNVLWDSTYGGSYWDRGYCVRQTLDGGYVIVGFSGSFGAGWYDVYLIKMDSLGSIRWEGSYGGTADDWGGFVQQTLDGGYVIVGETESFGLGESDVFLIKTDSLGNTLWDTTYGGSAREGGFSVQQTLDRGYVIAGYAQSFGPGQLDAYLVKTDSSGSVLWDTTYGGSGDDRGFSVQQTFDGGYIIAGLTESFGAGSTDVYLIKTDSAGTTLWQVTYGGTEHDWGGFVEQTLDGGYVIAGRTSSFGAGSGDVYLIKTDSLGRVLGIEEEDPRFNAKGLRVALLQNRPNPFHGSTVIGYSLPLAAQVTLEVYDIAGRLVESLVDERQEPGIHEVRWDTEDKASGIYFYSLQAGDFTDIKKMILLR